MRGLSLTQPWATLVAIGAKAIETRSWSTTYRGPLLIHAAKKFPRDCQMLCHREPFASVLIEAGYKRSEDLPTGQGGFSVADPRINGHARSVQHGVRIWNEPAPTVTGGMFPGQGPFAIADPRVGENGPRFNNTFRIVRWTEPSPAIAGPGGAGGQAVADPRTSLARERGDDYLTARHYGVLPWDSSAMAVTGSADHDNGMFSIADPRCNWSPNAHWNKLRVVDWARPTGTVIGGNRVDSGALSVADPRCAVAEALPAPTAKLVAIIRALDNTWHRPFTTLELAALQGLVDPDEHLELHGLSDTAWRERIGNAVPSPAAEAIASVMGTTLLLAWSGEAFQLNAMPIWVRPIAIALSVKSEAVV